MKINFKKYENALHRDQKAERCAHYIFIVSSKYPYKRSENLTVFDIKWGFLWVSDHRAFPAAISASFADQPDSRWLRLNQ